MRGTVSDRPWGITLGKLASDRVTGQLILTTEDGKKLCIGFSDGAVVGASSPMAADSVARIALQSQLVSSTQVQDIAKKVAAFPDRDEVELVAEIARLSAEQMDRLRRRLITQRAGRTFSVDRGEWAIQERILLPIVPGIQVDIAAAIYLGATMNLSEQRLTCDLRSLGARFVMKTERLEDVSRFGFSDVVRPILEELYTGTSLPELDAKYREIEPRVVQAIVYALVSTGLCEAAGPAVREIKLEADLPPMRSVIVDEHELEPQRSRTVTFEAPTAIRRSPISSAPPVVPRTITPRTHAVAARATIASGLTLIEQGADHFALLGVPPDASIDAVRSAYVRLACQLHPDKLPALGIAESRNAQRVFGAVSTAFTVLTDPVRRADYVAGLGHAAAAPARPPPTPAQTAAENARLAADAAERGLAALRRDDTVQAITELMRATQLVPSDVDHQALLAWARFCAAADKQAVALETRRTLERAIFKSQNPLTARFYLGRVERMLGRVREALHHFREVIALEPGHHDAKTEIRLLELRATGITDRRRR